MKRIFVVFLIFAILVSIVPTSGLSVLAATKYEYALFPMRYMRVTQGVDEGSHLKSNAIDLGGQDTGVDNVRAPFTGVVKRIYTSCNAVWFQSKSKVRFADGTLDYMTMLLIHDNDISDLEVGSEFKQGEVFYQEGTKGNATGNHVHIEVARGRTTNWYKATTTTFNGQSVEVWALTNNIEPWKALHLGQIIAGKDTIVKKDYGYDWVTLKAHTVTFCYENGEVLATEYVYHGDDATYTGTTPVKEFDTDAHYIFNGWDKAITNITVDTTCIAQFEAIPHSPTYKEIDESNHTGTCSCGYTATEPHNWSEGVLNNLPGCETEGMKTYTCIACEATRPEMILPTGHSYMYKDKGENHEAICASCGDSFTEEHKYVDHSCICGAVEILAPITDGNIVINHSLNLASDISINYAVKASLLAEYDSFRMEIKVPVYNGNVSVEPRTVIIEPVLNGSYYYFTMADVTAVNMNDELLATLRMYKGTQEYVSEVDRYSIVTYALNQLNKAGASGALKTLCADLLRYGGAAQSFKEYRTDALAVSAMTEEHKSFLSDIDKVTFGNVNTVYNDLENPMITWAGKTLNLGSKVVVKFIFNAGAYTGDIAKLKLQMVYADYSGTYRVVTLSNPVVYNEAKRQYAFEFDGLMAAELRSPLSVAVYIGDVQVSQTLQYSADTYGNNKTGALADLCKALFAYSDSAKKYFT